MSITGTLQKIPWRMILRIYSIIRSHLFIYRRVETKYFVLDMDVDDVEVLFGKKGFTNDWEFSYKYRGEDMNMRKPFYKNDEWEWYQLHIRGFVNDESEVEVQGHTELEPTEHPKAHIYDVNLNRREGFEMIKEILDIEGVEYRVVTP